MALYSQRFWSRLAALDARVVVAQRSQREASERMRVASTLVKGAGLEDFWRELRLSTATARINVSELRHFCVGRNRSLAPRRTDTHSPGTGFEIAD